jgi:hypothetical protein
MGDNLFASQCFDGETLRPGGAQQGRRSRDFMGK